MAVEFLDSADKHRERREDAIYAMLHAVGSDDVESRRPLRPGETCRVFVGPAHGQTDRLLEVIATLSPPSGVTIFHVQELTDLFRHLVPGEEQ